MGPEPEDELSRIRQESIDRLDAGRLPLEAEKRLEDIRGRPNFFTSDLTVSEFALGHSIGVRPISQVMGSAVFHAGVTGSSWRSWGMTSGAVANPWNSARTSALKRLAMEARLAGADAVIGVHIRSDAREFGPGSVEFQAIGTAVKIAGATTREGEPILSALSGQDYFRLRQAGGRVVGLVATTQAVYGSERVRKYYGRGQTREYEGLSRAVQGATQSARDELKRQATAMRAHGIVGVKVERRHYEGEYESSQGYERVWALVVVHAIGTAIIEGLPTPSGDRTTVMPVRRLDGQRVTRVVRGPME